jgi:hypothetical protein
MYRVAGISTFNTLLTEKQLKMIPSSLQFLKKKVFLFPNLKKEKYKYSNQG